MHVLDTRRFTGRHLQRLLRVFLYGLLFRCGQGRVTYTAIIDRRPFVPVWIRFSACPKAGFRVC